MGFSCEGCGRYIEGVPHSISGKPFCDQCRAGTEQAYHARGAGREERLMADCHRLCGTDLVGWYGRCECGEDFEFDYEYLQHQVKVYQAKLDALKSEPGADTGTTPQATQPPQELEGTIQAMREYCLSTHEGWPIAKRYDEAAKLLKVGRLK